MSQKNRNYAEKFLDLRIRKELKEYGDEAYVAYEKHIGKIPVVVLPDMVILEKIYIIAKWMPIDMRIQAVQ